MPHSQRVLFSLKSFYILFFLPFFFFGVTPAQAQPAKTFALTARSAVVVDAGSGGILYGKNPYLKLPPASTTKLMTVLVALDKLPFEQNVAVSVYAESVSPSKAGLSSGATYAVRDLVAAALISSSNDAAVTLAEAAGGSEKNFADLMNEKAKSLGMNDTHFINATGLTERHKQQYSTAYDLTILMRRVMKDPRLDAIMGMTKASIRGSDGRYIILHNHNKMLWKTPKHIKGKTGWTIASKHTFVGTNYSSNKLITFAMLSSKKPWTDIERLADIGLSLKNSR